MALVMPKDSHVRFWYSVSSYNSLLVILKGKGYIEPLKTLEVRPNHLMFDPKRSLGPTDLRPDHHCRVYVWLREVFLRALEVPHSADYLNAMSLTNFAPDIVDPDTAIKRLDNNEHLYSTLPGRDMTDDRYLLELEPPERAIASMCDLKCAEYLLIKHTFFREFYWEVMRSEKKIGGEEKRERVRSDTAHQQWASPIILTLQPTNCSADGFSRCTIWPRLERRRWSSLGESSACWTRADYCRGSRTEACLRVHRPTKASEHARVRVVMGKKPGDGRLSHLRTDDQAASD